METVTIVGYEATVQLGSSNIDFYGVGSDNSKNKIKKNQKKKTQPLMGNGWWVLWQSSGYSGHARLN